MRSHIGITRRSGRRALGYLCLMLLFVLLVCSSGFFSVERAMAQGPQITISPGAGFPGSPVTITGDGFPPPILAILPVTISMDGQAMLFPDAGVDIYGKFTIYTNVPDIYPGLKTVVATAGSTSASVSFTVLEPQVTVKPSSGPPGTNVVISGTFNRAAEFVNIAVDSMPIARVAISIDHYFAANWTAELPAGLRTVTASAGSASVSSSFTVLSPQISLSPSSATVGSIVHIEGSGFPASSTGTVFMDSVALTPFKIDVTGAFSVSAPVPVLEPGEKTVSANSGAAQASASFYLLSGPARISVDPPSGAPGARLIIQGTGFPASSTVTVAMDGRTLGPSIRTDEAGEFSMSPTVPKVSAGETTLTATSGAVQTSVPFEVLPETGMAWYWVAVLLVVALGGGGYAIRKMILRPRAIEMHPRTNVGIQETAPGGLRKTRTTRYI